MKYVTFLSVVLFCVAGFAAESKKCVEREVLITLRSNQSVHYSEKDEGRVVGKIKVLDCGQAAATAPGKTQPGSNPGVRPACPPNVQDCIPR
ncbi:MAG: hypothetical protein K0R29_1546 [Pseudobdellovibrio sp.]|jgi:hypothetical protein|nr:hypothetical protein [Pseudobdellovibrio sp.]